jgi:hypothetical protein
LISRFYPFETCYLFWALSTHLAWSPLSLLITGEKLDQANEVYINDILAPEFVVLSSGRILAQVPSSERQTNLRKLAIVANVPSVNRKSLLHFEIGHSIKGIKGLEKLVQAFCKLLLQTPGTDRFRPNEGGGLLKLTGRNVSRGDSKNLQASVVGAVTRTRDQLLARQGANRRIPADERLLTASVEAVGFDTATTTLSARIALSAVSGRLAVANLTL